MQINKRERSFTLKRLVLAIKMQNSALYIIMIKISNIFETNFLFHFCRSIMVQIEILQTFHNYTQFQIFW